jgi:predicted amidohydrolase YtcJ
MAQRLILTAANIITMTAEGERAQALAIEGGRLVRVGARDAVADLIRQGWPVLDLQGRTVLPGFIDTHQHLMLTGLLATAIALDEVGCLDEVLERVAAGSRETPSGAWVRAGYLNEQRLREKRMPTREELDRACSGRPVFVLHTAAHMCALNTRGLELLQLPDSLEGVDREGGRPTGVVRDPGILTHVHPVMARLIPEAVKVAAMEAAGRKALEKGITTLHALDGGDLGPGETRIIMAHRERLPVRVVCYNQNMDLGEVRRLGLPRVGGCICADGAFEAHTAALFEPYSDQPENYGALTYSQEVMDRFVLEAHREGLQIAVHCESERAIEQVLAAMEKALRAHPRADHRHRIEHLELPTYNQIARMAAAGIMAAMQPAFIPAFIGSQGMQGYAPLLGTARLRRLHPYRTLRDHGIPVCGGSDSPVTPYNPLAGVQAAVLHPNPDERLTIHEALELFTVAAAWSAFEEAQKGSLAPGKLADLVVLERDPFAVAADEIAAIRVDRVFVGGRQYEI